MAAGGLPEELERVLQTHSEKTKAIANSFTQELIDEPVPPLIYHYTNDSGLRGILETGQLWFTDIFSLNDPSELNHGIRHALDVLDREANSGPPEAKLFSKLFADVLTGNVESSASYFVCCFSTTSDDLGQWRAYADDGRGYVIGFDAGVLERAFANAVAADANLHSTFPVSYDDRRLRELHERFVAETIPAISTPRGMNLNGEVISEFLQELSSNLASSCFSVSLYFKHEAYSNEQEYRFLQMYPAPAAVPDLKIRSRPYSLVRFREFDWKAVADKSVREIICGPASDQKTAAHFAYDCLREYLPASEIISIKRSQIPYRSVQT